MTPTPDPDPPDMPSTPGLFDTTIREFLAEKDPLPETIDLTTIPKGDIPAHAFCLVTPPPAVMAYLDSDDEMTEHIVNLMEDTIDKHYDLPPGFYVTADRVTTPDGRLRVKCFTLMPPPPAPAPRRK